MRGVVPRERECSHVPVELLESCCPFALEKMRYDGKSCIPGGHAVVHQHPPLSESPAVHSQVTTDIDKTLSEVGSTVCDYVPLTALMNTLHHGGTGVVTTAVARNAIMIYCCVDDYVTAGSVAGALPVKILSLPDASALVGTIPLLFIDRTRTEWQATDTENRENRDQVRGTMHAVDILSGRTPPFDLRRPPMAYDRCACGRICSLAISGPSGGLPWILKEARTRRINIAGFGASLRLSKTHSLLTRKARERIDKCQVRTRKAVLIAD